MAEKKPSSRVLQRQTERLQPTIKDFIQAGYPCLFMPTVEPDVAEQKVRDALKELNMDSVQFGIWKVTVGLMVGRADGTDTPRKEKEDLIDCLAWMQKQKDPIVACFHNVRQFVGNFQVIQQMIDTAMVAKTKGSHIVLIGSHIELPPELRNLVTFVDCPLPSQDQITEEYGKLIRAYQDEITLPESAEEREELILDAAKAAVGLPMLGAENAMALSFAMTEGVDLRVIQAQKEQEVKKSDVLEFIATIDAIEDVGGFAALKDWLQKRRTVFTKEAREYGLPYPKGILIVGPGGTGKSLVAKATASFLRLPLLRLDMGKVFRSLQGESEAAIRMALQVAEAVSPIVLWLDEIDKGLAGMRGSGELDSGVTARVISTILTWRQETTYPVMMVATANDVTSIPSMVYRKGRFDEIWATDLPTDEERREIFAIHIRKRRRDPSKYNLALLAKMTDEHTGAEIESEIEDAMFSAFQQKTEFTTDHILNAIHDTIPQAKRSKEEIDNTRAWVQQRARLVSGGDKPGIEKDTAKVRHIGRKTKK